MFKSLLILIIGDFDISTLNMLSNNRIFEQEMVRKKILELGLKMFGLSLKTNFLCGLKTV